MKSDRNESFPRKRAIRTLEDILRYPQATTDERIIEKLKRVLTAKELGEVECLSGLVARRKLLVVCRKPDELSEVILIDRRDPKKLYSGRLTLKRENDPGEA